MSALLIRRPRPRRNLTWRLKTQTSISDATADYESAKEEALHFLAPKARSRVQVERHLRKSGFPQETVRDVIGRLEELGLVDDRALAEQVISESAGRGDAFLLERFSKLGLSPALAEDALQGADPEDNRALREARAKLGRLQSLPPEVTRRRLYGHLARRGFDPDTVSEAVETAMSLGPAGID